MIISLVFSLFLLGWQCIAGELRDVTTEAWDDFLAERHYSLVMFYLENCEHAQRTMPEFEYLATHYDDDNVIFGQMRINEETSVIGERYGITTSPAVVLFNGPEDYRAYEGARTSTKFKKWLKKATSNDVEVISDLKVPRVSNSCTMVLHGNYNENILDKYSTVAKANKHKHTFKRILPDRNDTEARIMAVGEDARETNHVVNEDTDFPLFVRVNSLPLVSEANQYTYKRLFGVGLDICWIIADDKDIPDLLPIFTGIAHLYRDECIFTTINVEKEGQIARMILGSFENPTLARTFGGTGRYKLVLFNEAHDDIPDLVNLFMDNIKHKRIEPFLASQPIQDDDMDVYPKRIVGDTINDFIDGNDNIILYTYTPVCLPCKVYEKYFLQEVAGALGNVDGLVVGTIEAVTNEVKRDDWVIAAFPLIYVKKSGETSMTPIFIDTTTPKETHNAEKETMEEYLETAWCTREERRRIVESALDYFDVEETPHKLVYEIDLDHVSPGLKDKLEVEKGNTTNSSKDEL